MKVVSKKIHGKEARAKMMEAIDQLADVVGSTMGGKGRNVILDKEFGSPLIVNDGATIANEIFFKDSVKNNAAQLVKDAANRTNQLAGDGTTSTTVLTRAIIKQGWQEVDKGANPVALRKELLNAMEEIEANLKAQSVKVDKVEDLMQIAKVSVQDDDLGNQIGTLMFNLGKDGAVAIKESLEPGVHFESNAGMRIEGALQAGVIDNEDRREARLTDAKVLVLKDSPEDHEFESKWIDFMRKLTLAERLPDGNIAIKQVLVPVLLIVAEKLSRRFIMSMMQNKNIIKWAWFRPSTAGKNMNEIYKDFVTLTGGKIVDEEAGVHLSQITLEDLGTAKLSIVGRHELVVTVEEGKLESNGYLDRINDVKGQIENAEDEVEREQIKERLANLKGGVATVKVLAATEQDTLELKLRIEDAINASRAAMEEGCVAGGGVALLNAAKRSDTIGEKVLKEACKASIRQILYNAGYEHIDAMIMSLEHGEGINVLTDDVTNMIEAGIIDPLKVVRQTLINATSVAGLLLTSEYVVTSEEDELDVVKNFFNK
jgi:chaperonin GroEL